MASSTTSSPLMLILLLSTIAKAQDLPFIFHGFNKTVLILDRVSIIKPSGALRLTNKTQNAIGHAFYPYPIPMSASASSPNASSFSTTFAFQIVPPSSGRGGFGLAFTLAPSNQLPGAADEHYLGLFNSSNDGLPSNHIFAVEFDTVNGFQENADSEGNHVGININSMKSKASEAASSFNETAQKEDFLLDSGRPIQAWIEYDGVTKKVNVTVCPMWQPKPKLPLISFPVDLSTVVKDMMYVGFSASTGAKASSHYILGWSFSLNGTAPPLNLSLLPVPPHDKNSPSYRPSVIVLIVSLCFVTFLLVTILTWFLVCKKWQQAEDLEDWELECPHRFHYRDLYKATKGFKKSEIIGVGGFGSVFKGRLPTSGNEVAVKKITRDSIEGLREFTAEIESLGRLRHKNLVNLQGWCKTKNDLLLVYDYIPNGSLASLLFNRERNVVLNWDQRFNIVKGIAAGLLYLHEEWEKVVIHRDVKSSNVLIDAEMNGRLGDFGLARLYDHGTMSHTTNIVGTIGYISPELARTGQASASSDAYAYGVLLLEVATGRRPIAEAGDFSLRDWVAECHQKGKILDAADPKLKSSFVVEEMELILGLGLLCSHGEPQDRPTMRKVLRYLNNDDKLPLIADLGSKSYIDSLRLKSKALEAISDYMITSDGSSSVVDITTSSIDAGRWHKSMLL